MVEERDLFTRIAYSWDAAYIDEPLAISRVHQESWTWKHPELSPKEKTLMLKKFAPIFPCFEEQFQVEIKQLQFEIQYEYARIDWMNGNRRQVRKRLKPFLKIRPRLIIPILSSFVFTYSAYNKIQSLYRVSRKGLINCIRIC